MKIGVLKETAEHEKRVALSPEIVKKLTDAGHEVQVEAAAGVASSFPDHLYTEAGAHIASSRKELLQNSSLLCSVQYPPQEDLEHLQEETAVLTFIWPLQHPERLELLQQKKLTGLSMDAIPRISRAQNMDALSSMSSIAGYKAALIAADTLDRYLPMMMTAAGTIPPAKALVLGAGVAGLQAIATCKRLGARVEAYDIRPAVKEQVESLGATFVEVDLGEEDTETKGGYAKETTKDQQQRQREVLHNHVQKSDIVITTALIPGKPAPVLVTKAMVEDMSPGSVIVDLAAENGGNCEYTQAGETVDIQGVQVIGPVNLPSQLAHHASLLYAKNVYSLLSLLIDDDGNAHFNFEDEILLNTTLTHQGEIISPMLK